MNWINVDDRLPDISGFFLIHKINYNFNPRKSWLECASFNAVTKKFNWSDHTVVTHWMPLPSPPETDNDK